MIKEKEIPKQHRFPLKPRNLEQLSSGRLAAKGGGEKDVQHVVFGLMFPFTGQTRRI
jgi:hypothetical protein